jgi:hypothetical protein
MGTALDGGVKATSNRADNACTSAARRASLISNDSCFHPQPFHLN